MVITTVGRTVLNRFIDRSISLVWARLAVLVSAAGILAHAGQLCLPARSRSPTAPTISSSPPMTQIVRPIPRDHPAIAMIHLPTAATDPYEPLTSKTDHHQMF